MKLVLLGARIRVERRAAGSCRRGQDAEPREERAVQTAADAAVDAREIALVPVSVTREPAVQIDAAQRAVALQTQRRADDGDRAALLVRVAVGDGEDVRVVVLLDDDRRANLVLLTRERERGRETQERRQR